MDRAAVYREGPTGEAVIRPFEDLSLTSRSAGAGCALKGWSKDRQRGVYILIIKILTLRLVSCIAGRPGSDAGFFNLNAWACILPALLGTWCGLGWYRRLSDAQFAGVVNVLLIASGAALAL
jgi:hypothetical protein